MNRKILTIIFTALLLVLSYVGFSFFQAYKIKKYLSEAAGNVKISKDSNFSIGEISIKDFPLSRKIKLSNIKLTSSSGILMVDSAKIKLKVLDNNLTIENIGLITLQDQGGATKNFIELKPDVILKVNLDEQKDLFEIKIINLGCKIFDKDKKPLLETQNKDAEMFFSTTSEGFRYSDHGLGYSIHNIESDTIFSGNAYNIAVDFATKGDVTSAKINLNFTGFSEIEKGKVIADDKNSNLAFSAEFSIKPGTKNPALSPQAQESARELYSQLWSFDLKNFSIAVSNYKLTLNGVVSNSEEDPIPTAQATLTIENFDSLITNVRKLLDSASQEVNKKISDEKNSLTPQDSEKLQQIAMMSQMGIAFIEPFSEIAKKTATKNTLSKDNLLVFEFRREKGQDLLINNSSITELFTEYTNSLQNSAKSQNPVVEQQAIPRSNPTGYAPKSF